MTTFGRVLPELVRVCEAHPESARIRKFCVVRDVRGRVRLVVELADAVALEPLATSLSTALGAYFAPPILSASGGGEAQRLAKTLIGRAAGKWPAGWPTTHRNILGAAATPLATGTRWVGLERTIGKEAWLNDAPARPWPLEKDRTPPIVTFHSFKGGVGRTTLVAAHAIRLATELEKRVAVVDLDVEAPGIGALFNVSTERGVLDILVDHIATGGDVDLTDASGRADVPGPAGDRIKVFPAGRFDETYIPKLARLDFSSTEPGRDNPVGEALRALLKKLRPDFDIILLDARAGLHDLAGMSLHGLAHVDVLVFRGTRQNFDGLGQTFRALRPRAPEVLLVETMLPPSDDEFKARSQRTRDRIYELMCAEFYDNDEPPQPSDVGEPHDVLHVRRKEWLDGVDSIGDHAQMILNEVELKAVSRRVDELCLLEAAAGLDEVAEVEV